ncbi:hypothetical protein PS1M3_04180 [Pseudoalteromonas sp. PS1M3]|nr:hypothetical protein PS1M3_04180 [Pseudoalteromonas sp. PS1M3]
MKFSKRKKEDKTKGIGRYALKEKTGVKGNRKKKIYTTDLTGCNNIKLPWEIYLNQLWLVLKVQIIRYYEQTTQELDSKSYSFNILAGLPATTL